MAFLVKVDEDLPRTVTQQLREHGYDATNVIEEGMGGIKDPELWQAIQQEKRFLITADKGFANMQAHPPGQHGGVLLLRPDEDGVRPIVELLSKLLNSHKLDNLAGTITVVTPRGVRIRRV